MTDFFFRKNLCFFFPACSSSYYVLGIDLEPFYLLFKNMWWGAINEVISTLKPKRLPLTDIQAMEQFKKRFGYKKAIKCKVC